MSDNFIDLCPDLSKTIDIGGVFYYLGSERPVEFAFRGRSDFLADFEPITKQIKQEIEVVECILRKYLPHTLQPVRCFNFVSGEEKELLKNILSLRLKAIKNSAAFTSSYLKNTALQRSYIGIQKILEEIGGPQSSLCGMSIPSINISIPTTCEKTKKYVKNMLLQDETKRNNITLAMSYFLSQPGAIPLDIECEWAALVQKMGSIDLQHIIAVLKSQGQPGRELNMPNNAFKRLGLQDGGAKTPKIKNALDELKEIAGEISNDSAKKDMLKRIESILTVLEIQKNLGKDGASLNRPLNLALRSLHDYYKVLYDPIYSLLESTITVEKSKIGGPDLKTVLLPELLTILHICNFLDISDSSIGGHASFGVYRIIGIPDECLDFFKQSICNIMDYNSKLDDDKERRKLNLAIKMLPKVRLSSFLRRNDFINYKNSEKDYYVQFFTVGDNLEITKSATDNIKDFFNPDNLFIAISESQDAEIPLNFYEIDYRSVLLTEPTIKSTKIGLALNGSIDSIKDVAELKDYAIFTDAELALSIFIGLKEIIPK